jgi:hypothetical protein
MWCAALALLPSPHLRCWDLVCETVQRLLWAPRYPDPLDLLLSGGQQAEAGTAVRSLRQYSRAVNKGFAQLRIYCRRLQYITGGWGPHA